MDIFNLVSGICSIVGLVVSLISLFKIIQVEHKMQQDAKADNNSTVNQAGRDIRR